MAFSVHDFFIAFATAINSRDRTAIEAMLHPDFTAVIPQSGEESRGFEQFWAQMEAYPGGPPEVPLAPVTRFVGDDERWAISPSFTVVPLAAPTKFTMLSTATYPDGKLWYSVALVELRDQRVYRIEFYFAPELSAPLSRSITEYVHG